MGRPRLSAQEKARRGTLRPSIELAYSLRDAADRGQRPPGSIEWRQQFAVLNAYAADISAGKKQADKWMLLACFKMALELARSK